MIKGFKNRVLTRADSAWWQFWHEHKDDLRRAGFSIDKVDDQWLLSYEPNDSAPLRDDPVLEAKREAAWHEHAQAIAAAAAACAAERKAHMRARKLYTPDEWHAPLVKEALMALAEFADPPATAQPEPPPPASAVAIRELDVPSDATRH